MTGTNGTAKTAYQPIAGKVTATNSHGLKLSDSAEWLNYSKFAEAGDIAHCKIGDTVGLVLDGQGYIRKLAVSYLGEPGQTAPEPAVGTIVPNHSAATPDKDTQIRRMACLNTSVALLYGNNGRGNVDEVLNMASMLEAWILRS